MTFTADCRPILIGSLPLTDHDEAMRLIAAHTPQIPLWPQLPKLPKEGMIRQFLTGFPGLIDDGKRYWVDQDAADFTGLMADFYDAYFRIKEDSSLLANSRFSLGNDSARGFAALLHFLNSVDDPPLTIKGQVTGPVTTGIGLKDAHGKSIIYDDNLRDILTKLLALKARWQVTQFQRFTGERPPIVFIDEPGMVSFGSSGFSGISAEMVSQAVAEVISEIQGGGGLAGIHICANGDWSPALASKADIISFDAYFYFDNFILYRSQLQRYLARGGILAWGIVPTGDPLVVEQESVDSLFAKWRQQLTRMSEFGRSELQLMHQTLIAPSCGTGSLTVEQARKVLAMTAELSQRARVLLQEQAELAGETDQS
jgi:hypothetical protein